MNWNRNPVLQVLRCSGSLVRHRLRSASSGVVPLVKARHIMRPLSLHRRKMLWGYQSPPQKQLLVLPVQDDHPHDKVLILTEQIPDLVLGGPEFRTE